MVKKRKKIIMFRVPDYDLAFFYILDKMGYEPLEPLPTTDKTLSLGTRYSPETLCLPSKYLLGNYIEALDEGAEVLVLFNACNTKKLETEGRVCRGGYFGEMHRAILNDLGYKFDFIVFPFGDLIAKKLKEQGYSDAEAENIIKVYRKKIELYEDIRGSLLKYRPRAKHLEQPKTLYFSLLKKLEKKDSIEELEKFQSEIEESYKKIPIYPDKDVLKIAIIGEFASLNVRFLNQRMYSLLGELGVEVDITLKLTNYLGTDEFHDMIVEKATPYIGHYIGGHGQNTVGNLIYAVESGYDGVIHLMPFTCLPETIGRYAINEIANDYDFPTLSLVLDEHTSRTGVVTRIEAYVDLLRARKEKKQRSSFDEH